MRESRSVAATATTPAGTPAKRSLRSVPNDPTGATAGTTGLPPELQPHAGETFVDGGHYVWRLEASGDFVCVAQPAARRSLGAKVAATSPELWQALCGMAIKALVPAAIPQPAQPDAEPSAERSSRFSLEGFLELLAATGLIDIGSQVGPSGIDRDHITNGAP